MASYQDLLDAIGRVREATGSADAWRDGLSGDDIAVASSPISPPGAIGAVLAKVVAGHPDVFGPPPGPPGAPPRVNEGVAATAIRAAETALAQQRSTAAQVDLQVVNAVLNAHAAHADGAAQLERLQREVESAVLARTDLGTPAGAREFQRFLIGKVRDIRTVVDAAGLDATSKAALAAALASLYVSSGAESSAPGAASPGSSSLEPKSAAPQQGQPQGSAETQSVPTAVPPGSARGSGPGGFGAGGFGLGGFGAGEATTEPDWLSGWEAAGLPDLGGFPPEPAALPVESLPPVRTGLPGPVSGAPPPMVAAPLPTDAGWGAAMPAGMTSGMTSGLPGGLLGSGFPSLSPSALSDLGSGSDAGEWLPGRLTDRGNGAFDDITEQTEPEKAPTPPEEQDWEPATGQTEPADPSTAVRLPDGDTVTAPTPELAAVISAAVSGTPIPDAFRQLGMTLPPPGSPISPVLDATRLLPGDVGVYADRYALVLGNGKALVDSQIQPLATVTGPDFLGWLKPPVAHLLTAPELPAPNWPAQTAPS